MSGDYLEKIDLVSDLLFNGVFRGIFNQFFNHAFNENHIIELMNLQIISNILDLDFSTKMSSWTTDKHDYKRSASREADG